MTVRTFGVEEEFLLVHPASGTPIPVVERTIAHAQESAGGPKSASLEREFKKEQAEIGSAPTTTATALAGDLRRLRHAASAAAAASGAQIAALATNPDKLAPTPTSNERYDRMAEEFGLIARQQLTCGQHVHVGVATRSEGVAVLDRIAGWLPLILALSVNSPFWQGQDTGYSSYRTVLWGLWPTVGPVQPFGSEAAYDAAIADVLTTGSAMDDGMIYFDARLSAHFPTVEIRVADVCTDVEDAVLVAVLCRALVEWAAGSGGRVSPCHTSARSCSALLRGGPRVMDSVALWWICRPESCCPPVHFLKHC